MIVAATLSRMPSMSGDSSGDSSGSVLTDPFFVVPVPLSQVVKPRRFLSFGLSDLPSSWQKMRYESTPNSPRWMSHGSGAIGAPHGPFAFVSASKKRPLAREKRVPLEIRSEISEEVVLVRA